MKLLKFTEQLVGLDAIFEHRAVVKLFEPYYSKAILDEKNCLFRVARDPESIIGYIVPVDPATNYGRSEDIYYTFHNKEEGIHFINKMEATSTLCNGALRGIIITENSEIVVTDTFYENSRENRARIANSNTLVGKIR